MKTLLVVLIIVLCAPVCFAQDKEGFRPDLTSMPAKFYANGIEETGFNSPFMLGVAYDIVLPGGVWTPGLYGFTEIDTGDEDGDVKFGAALNLKTPWYGIGFGGFYEFYESGKDNGGLQGFRKSNSGFLVSWDIALN